MPVPPSNYATPVATAMLALPDGTTLFTPGQTQSTNTSANPNPQMQVVGVDSVVFKGQGNPSAPTMLTVTFPNLPVRDAHNNPLTPLYSSKNSLQVNPNSHLLLTCFVQGSFSDGTVVTAAPKALTGAGVSVPGPFLGSENFVTFQAVVTIANSPVTQTVMGSVVAHLHLALG